MSGIYWFNQLAFGKIGKYYKIPNNKLLSINLAIVTSIGIHIINDANRYEGKHRKILHNSAVAQTITAVASTAVCTIFLKTFREQTIGLLASATLIIAAGVYFERSPRDSLFIASFLSLSPYMMNVTFDRKPG